MQEVKTLYKKTYKPIDAIKEYSRNDGIKVTTNIKSALSYNFVYDRKYGMFYHEQNSICHDFIMSILLIYRLFGDKIKTSEDFDYYFSKELINTVNIEEHGFLYLKYFKGTAYKSSMDYRVQTYAPESLTISETRLFGDFDNINFLSNFGDGTMEILIMSVVSPELVSLLEGKSNE